MDCTLLMEEEDQEIALHQRENSQWKAHRTLGHLSARQLKETVAAINGWELTTKELGECDICLKTNATRHVKGERHGKTNVPGEDIIKVI